MFALSNRLKYSQFGHQILAKRNVWDRQLILVFCHRSVTTLLLFYLLFILTLDCQSWQQWRPSLQLQFELQRPSGNIKWHFVIVKREANDICREGFNANNSAAHNWLEQRPLAQAIQLLRRRTDELPNCRTGELTNCRTALSIQCLACDYNNCLTTATDAQQLICLIGFAQAGLIRHVCTRKPVCRLAAVRASLWPMADLKFLSCFMER